MKFNWTFSGDQLALVYAILECSIEQYEFVAKSPNEDIENDKPKVRKLITATYNEADVLNGIDRPASEIKRAAKENLEVLQELKKMFLGLPHTNVYNFEFCYDFNHALVETLRGFLYLSKGIPLLTDKQFLKLLPQDGDSDHMASYRALIGGMDPKEWFLQQNKVVTELLNSRQESFQTFSYEETSSSTQEHQLQPN